jgi:hypothetical protein
MGIPLTKSHYAPSDPQIEGRGFVNHIHHIVRDMGVDQNGNPLVEAYKIIAIQNMQAASGTGGKPRNIALLRKVLGGDGLWHMIGIWQEGQDYDESSAAGSVDVDPISGRVLVVMSFGKAAGSRFQYQSWEAMIERATFAPPIVRPPDSAQGPPGPPGPAGNGGIVLFSTPLISPAWEQRTLAGGLWVDIAATFGAPPASAYLVRFVASAAVANVRVRAGTEQAPFFLTLNTQIPGLEMHTQGWIPGPRAFVSVVNGPAQVWLQVLGMGI